MDNLVFCKGQWDGKLMYLGLCYDYVSDVLYAS